jgi:nitronate monooxygenase
MTSIASLFGTKYPLIQAPMAGVQDAALAIAVSNAGGLGSLPCATLTASMLREQLTAIRDATTKPLNVNFFSHVPPVGLDIERQRRWHAALAPFYTELGLDPALIPSGPGRLPFSQEAADVLEEFPPAVVSFHFGLPSDAMLARVRKLGSKVISSATTVDEAIWLEQRGVDAIIAQGLEAGGHRGMFLSTDVTTQIGTFALIPQICDAVKVPVIAAGGIADEHGIEAALALGASAVQLGTAYLLCPESTTSAVHRAALREPRAKHTALTNLFSGAPARGIVNRFMEALGPMSDQPPPFPLAAAGVGPLRAEAERRGSDAFTPLWAGQNVTHLRDVPAAQITRELGAALLRFAASS